MRMLKRAAVVAALGLAMGVSSTPVATAGTAAYQWPLQWGGQTRGVVIFDAAGNETYYVRDAYGDSYGVYTTWWRGNRSNTCDDSNGAGTDYVACGPFNFGEDLAFDTNVCSKDYSGSTLVDSKCSGRFQLGWT